METVATPAGLRARVAEWRREGQRVGLVPTMGALHEGHLRLVDLARTRADRVVATVFVNPLQFGPREDLSRYPRDLERDRALLEARGADLLFAPTVDAMYPEPVEVRLEPGAMASRWEGSVRPGHFSGVLTVVAKLFHLVGPDVACFGQKDFQQAALIRRMVRDLDWPLEVIVGPTVREADGLALSSRNRYLTPDDRSRARLLSAALRAAQRVWRDGATEAAAVERAAAAVFASEPAVTVDYIAVADPNTLEPVATVSAETVVMVAARVGTTRLIDNAILDQPIP
ncbi:MAG: pantoate--beta-alanine ligase [Gemmatimonadales bacterium]|nr:pantoate--beta-alanine ligase [Gemmatimonadales bacterium]